MVRICQIPSVNTTQYQNIIPVFKQPTLNGGKWPPCEPSCVRGSYEMRGIVLTLRKSATLKNFQIISGQKTPTC